MSIAIPVSFGELVDKVTILEIKREQITDPKKLRNVENELALLSELLMPLAADAPVVSQLRAELKRVNQALWDIEDQIRQKEAEGHFDEKFIELARNVYITNDERANIKKRINETMGSDLVEEKHYADY